MTGLGAGGVSGGVLRGLGKKLVWQCNQSWGRAAAIALLLLSCVLSGWLGGSGPALALDYNRESLVGADFSGKVLTDASFTKANMRESNLSHSDLRGVSFFATNLEAANLEGADLRNATLDAARLSQANLSNAILAGAFASNAKFDGAIIVGADFTDVEVRDDVRAMLCQRATGVNPVTQRPTRETLDCP